MRDIPRETDNDATVPRTNQKMFFNPLFACGNNQSKASVLNPSFTYIRKPSGLFSETVYPRPKAKVSDQWDEFPTALFAGEGDNPRTVDTKDFICRILGAAVGLSPPAFPLK